MFFIAKMVTFADKLILWQPSYNGTVSGEAMKNLYIKNPFIIHPNSNDISVTEHRRSH